MPHQLNIKQLQAVHHIHTPLLVLAGAGSGKTSVITNKIAYLIKQNYYKAHHIAAVTFTNKAANEMNFRLRKMLPAKNARGVTISTFHTLGLKIIRTESHHLGLKNNFTIYDTEDSKSLLKALVENKFPVWDKIQQDEYINELLHKISFWKNEYPLTEQLRMQNKCDPKHLTHFEFYQLYQQHLQTFNSVDFDDLINLPVKLFLENPGILIKWQKKLQYLLVDEYQDTNFVQYKLIRLLSQTVDQDVIPTQFTVVGDDDQSIYGWRGARPENLSILNEDFADLCIIKLEQNYRSSRLILNAANQLIKNNPHTFVKKLWSDHDYGEQIDIISAQEESSEIEHVISTIIDYHFRQQRSYADFAILYRGNYQSRNYEKKLQEHQIPYQITGGNSFFSYTEVKDIMAYLKLLINPLDDGAFLRIINTPRRQIGDNTIKKLSEYCQLTHQSLFQSCQNQGLEGFMGVKMATNLKMFYQWMSQLSNLAHHKSPIVAIKQMISDCDYFAWLMENSSSEAKANRRIDNVNELVDWLQRIQENEYLKTGHSKDLGALVNRLILLDILEKNEEKELTDCVSLMTLHSAKGLEFPYVFIVGVEEEIIPHLTSIENNDIDEERRLFYVGITRAKEKLILTQSAYRKRYGEIISTEPSRFIAELPDKDIKWISKEKSSSADKQQFAENSFAAIQALLE